MQLIEELIPKDKSDIESVERLFGHNYEQVKPIISRLLEWIQDGNWPVAYPMGKYLSTIAAHLTTEILEVLRSNDGAWKYQVLRWLVDNHPLNPEVRMELVRLRDSPSDQDIEEDIQESAERILLEDGC
jgi:hypothetical protein